jgi:hypothetical protein
MTIKTDIDQLVVDAAVVHNWANGSSSYSATMGAYTVRSPAKLIADKDTSINAAADGILAQSTTQATNAAASAATATTQAAAASASAALSSAAWSAALAANPDLNPWGRMNPATLTANVSLAAGYNAVSAGPLTIGDGVTVTLADTSNWSII